MNVFKTSDILFYIWPQRRRDRLISTCRVVLAVLLMFATLGMKLNLGPETNMSATGHVCSDVQHLICVIFSLRFFRFNRLFGVKLSTNRNL